MKSKKLLILVMNSDLYPSNTIVPFIKRTYLHRNYINLNIGQYNFPKMNSSIMRDIPYIYFQGGSKKTYFKKDTLFLPYKKDTYRKKRYRTTQPDRTLDCFEWVLENIDFDYIYRTTTTSYLNLEHLYDFIQDKQSDCYYAAPEMYHQDKENDVKIKFGSGVGFFLSKDLVECVVNNRNKWNYDYLDDVALGKLLIQDLGYELSNIKRQDFKKYPKFKDIDFNQFHYRFRLDIWGYPRFVEPLVLLSLHFKINYLKNPNQFKRIKNYLFDQICSIIFFVAKILYISPRETKLLQKNYVNFLDSLRFYDSLKK